MADLNLDDLQKQYLAEKEAADSRNDSRSRFGAIADSLSNIQGIGNFALGKMNPTYTGASRLAGDLEEKVDPAERMKNTLDRYRAQKEIKSDTKADAFEASQKDVNSDYSKKAREGYSRILGRPVPETLSASDLTSQFGKLSDYALKGFENRNDLARDQAKFGNERTLADSKAQSDMRMKAFEQSGDTRLLSLKQQGEMSKQGLMGQQALDQIGAHGGQDRLTKGTLSGADQVKLAGEAPLGTKSTEFKMSKLNGTDKARLDNVRMAHEGINAMASALNKGDSTWNLIGDNNFTMAERDFGEALGRMQSGGAISKPEEKRFLSMAPKAMDSPEIRAEKIANLQAEMGQRFKTLGFDQSEFGIKNVALNTPGSKADSAMVKTAVAGSAPSPADQQAIQWAKSNSGDPRAKGILQKLKDKGVL